MRRTTALLAAGLVGASTIAAAPAQQQSSPNVIATLEMELGDEVAAQGEASAGINAQYFSNFECDSDPDTYCQSVLIKVSNPYEEENAKKGRERANLDLLLTPTSPVNDFDLMLFESDEDGNEGAEIGRSGATPIADCSSSCESISAVITTTEDQSEVWVIAHVVYFAAYGDWTLDVAFTQ